MLRTGIEVSVLADPEILSALRYQFSGRVTEHGLNSDGRVELTLTELAPRPLAAQLAGHGRAVEVLNPGQELRHEFVRLANELRDQWL